MEDTEQTTRLVTLGEEAQDILCKVCEEHGINQEKMQEVISNLYALCAYTVDQIKVAFEALRDSIAESVAPALHALAESLQPLLGEDLFFMVPPQVKHLAYNHPKARVRNKNWNRMWKIRERYMKCHKQ